jgi:predicted AAA+ superfamily ATPase
MQRWQENLIKKDLETKMVFLVGPRQSGKTFLAKQIAKTYKKTIYLNYDSIDDKNIIDKMAWNPELDLIIFDELHKKPDWKNFIKGVYDTKKTRTRILVTGSARLDVYDQVGDSLAGRYFRHRLLPFSLAELKKNNFETDLDRLLERSGFPEPFLAQTDLDAKRWRQQYINSILSTDIFEIEVIQNLKAMRLIFEMLRKRVATPVSYRSLAEELGITINTVKKYIMILEALFVVFRVTPYSNNIARSILKEPKIYFFDTALVDHCQGARLENMIAVSLLKNIYAQNDYLAQSKSLHYLKTKDGQEVDFAIADNNKQSIETIIEVKTTDPALAKNLLKFSSKYNLPAIQVVQNLHKERFDKCIPIIPACDFLENLYL